MFESQRKVFFRNPDSLVFDRKLDTAIRSSTCHEWYTRIVLDNDTRNKEDVLFKLLLDNKTNLNDEIIRQSINRNIWPYILRDILQQTNTITSSKELNFADILTVAKKIIGVQLSSMYQNVSHPSMLKNIDHIETWLRDISAYNPILQSMLVMMHDMTIIVDKRGNKLPEEDYMCLDFTYQPDGCCTTTKWMLYPIKFIWTRTYACIEYRDYISIVPAPYVLLIHNKLADIFSVLMYAHFSSGTTLDADALDRTVEFLISLNESLLSIRDKQYDLVKALEAVCVGLTLHELEGKQNIEFLNVLLEDVFDKTKIYMNEQHWYMILQDASIPMRHELCCLSKVFGHPFVDMYLGQEKLYLNTTEQIELSDTLILKSIAAAKRSFIKTYIYKYHKWPPVVDNTLTPRLKTAKSRSMDPDSAIFLREYNSDVSLEDYGKVELLPCEIFTKLENYIPYLKDKTISLLRSEVYRRYILKDEDSDGIIKYKGMNRNSYVAKTRLLLYYLLNTSEITAHGEQLDWWMSQQEDFNHVLEYLCIRIVPKEKELKELFRGFGCKPYMSRVITSVLNKNTATYLDKYSTEQAMTLTELDILHKLNSFRRIQTAYNNMTPIYLVIDTSAWNNMFRSQAVDGLLQQTLGKIFGNNIYEKTQSQYEKTFIYVPDRSKTYFWDGQLGGIEGQHQYEWDVVYLAQIHVALQELGYQYFIFCKGDDVRVVLLIPDERLETVSIDKLRKQILDHLKTILVQYGHKINIAESYASLSYFAFSKSASCGLIELPQAYRKIQKCYGANNAFLPFLDDYIASSFSNAHSACKASNNYISPYMVALCWALSHLKVHDLYRKLSETEFCALLLTPSMVGGFPIIYLHNMSVRSESDLLTPYLHLISYTKDYDHELFQNLIKFLVFEVDESTTAVQGILVDPFSLPIKKPVNASSVLRKSLIPALREKVRNEEVKECLTLLNNADVNNFFELINSLNVYNPRILSVIYAATPMGFIDTLIRKFETGRSIIDAITISFGSRSARKVIKKVIIADIKVNKYRLSKLSGETKFDDIDYYGKIRMYDCPAQQADKLRHITWRKPVESVTMPPLQHQISITTIHDTLQNEYAKDNYFEATYTCKTSEFKRRPIPAFSCGNCKPFLGHKTKTGMRQNQTTRFLEKDELLTQVKNLLDIVSWCRMTDDNINPQDKVVGNCDLLIDKLLKCYLNVDPRTLAPFRAERKSGTVMHHIRSPGFNESIVPNVLSNSYTRYFCNTNTNKTVRNSAKHFKINFLHILCYSLSMILHKYNFSSLDYAIEMQLAIVINPCDYCTSVIIETPMVLNERLLGTVVFPDVKVLKLSDTANSIVLKSLAVDQRRYQHTGQPAVSVPAIIAQRAITQLLSNSTFHDRMSISNYTYRHPMTLDATEILDGILGAHGQKLIGLNELKSINPIEFFIAMVPLILWYIHSELECFKIDNLMIKLRVTPTVELPWLSAVNQIKLVGKLPHLITAVSSRTGVSYANISESVPQTCQYLAIAAMSSDIISATEDYPIIIMSFYEPEFILGYIQRVYYSRLRHAINNKIYNRYKQLLASAENIDDCMFVLAAVFMAIRCYELNEDRVTSLLYEMKESGFNSQHTLTLRPTEIDIEPDELYDDYKELNYLYKHFFLHGRLTEFEFELQEIFDYINSDRNIYDALIELVTSEIPTRDIVFYYTDYESCITRVRKEPIVSIHIQRLQFGAQPDVVLGINCVVPRIENVHNIIMPASSVMEPEIEMYFPNNIEFIEEHHILDHRWFYRHFFRDTTALCKLHEILYIYKMYPLPDYNRYYTLADGFGGFAALINANTSHSTIYFNTLITNQVEEVLPYAILDSYRYRSNSIEYGALQDRITDLTNESTVTRIIQEGPENAELFTCDAQTLGMDMDNRLVLLQNVCHIYLTKRSETGVLIIKLYLNEYKINSMIIGALHMFCNNLSLCKPKASGFNDEIYLIAAGYKLQYSNNFHQIYRYLHANNDAKMRRFIDTIRCNYNNSTEKSNVINYIPPKIRIDYTRISNFDPTCVIYLRYHLSLGIDNALQLQLARLPELSTTIFNKISELAVVAESEVLQTLEDGQGGVRPWDLKTLTAARRHFLHHMRLRGFITTINTIWNQRIPSIHISRIYRTFTDAMSLYPGNIYVPRLTFEEETKRDIYLPGLKNQQSPWHNFTVGVSCAMMLTAYKNRNTVTHTT